MVLINYMLESFQTSEDCIAIEFQFAVILHFVTSSCETEIVFNNLYYINYSVLWGFWPLRNVARYQNTCVLISYQTHVSRYDLWNIHLLKELS